ncbi:hypothetical protein ACWEWL_29515 [Streptomyces rochei]|uniref:Uncharacterized protein n=1 Tax=Streptomyces vinaceusdrappus TaxID=67376 RepID=A0ABY6C4H7_9ACTN|nr:MULTISPECIES: hypothetical protein [Streptomyces]UXI82841.1 hypothetical protein N6Q81_34700 [Streptomyces vinaceusdrappus]
MTHSVADHAWLPDHQLHVAATLAHVDATLERINLLVHQYTAQGPLALQETAVGNQVNLAVTGISPVPEALPRLVADALTQLRAVLEHTVYAEVEHRLARPLSAQESRALEMPAAVARDGFDEWLTHRWRRHLPPLHSGAAISQRLRALQPFQRRDPNEHPLKILVEYTNLAKHRMPTVAAARLGAVYAAAPHPGLTVSQPLKMRPQAGDGQPLNIGDVIASIPRGARVELSIVSTVSLQRPHTQMWNIAVNELADLEDWVRTTAIPTLITGSRDVAPLPPQMDIFSGQNDLRSALQSAGAQSAAERGRQRLQAATALANMLDPIAGIGMSEAISTWVVSLDMPALQQRIDRLSHARSSTRNLRRVVDEILNEVRAAESGRG